MYHNFRNCRVLINGTGILASNLSLGTEAILSPVYLSQQRHAFDYVADNGIGGSLKLTYYLTGVDFIKSYITNEKDVISGNLGGLYFNSGYIKTYGFNAIPNKPVEINTEFVFFDGLKGSFLPVFEELKESGILNFSDATLTDTIKGAVGHLNNITNLSYSFSSDVQPIYEVGLQVPKDVSWGPKQIDIQIETDNLTGALPISGSMAGIDINLYHPFNGTLSESYSVSGILYKKSFDISVGDTLRSIYGLKQNYVANAPTVTSFSPSTVNYFDTVTVGGTNFSSAYGVSFSGTPAISFTITNDTSISAIVPPEATSGPITVYTQGGQGQSVSEININYAPITITGISPITGLEGDTISILGENFFRINK